MLLRGFLIAFNPHNPKYKVKIGEVGSEGGKPKRGEKRGRFLPRGLVSLKEFAQALAAVDALNGFRKHFRY